MGEQVGYIRVSSVDQNTDRQLEGVELNKVFTDKASGKDTKRPQLRECLEYLRAGDTLHVHSMDRMGRNLMDLQGMVEDLTGKKISVTFHKEGLTFSGGNDAMQKLMLQIMGAVAEFERSLIRERQREGIAAAKAKGKHLGRKSSLTDNQKKEIRAKHHAGINQSALSREYGVSRATIHNVLKKEEVS